jgi:hypothetical protein
MKRVLSYEAGERQRNSRYLHRKKKEHRDIVITVID